MGVGRPSPHQSPALSFAGCLAPLLSRPVPFPDAVDPQKEVPAGNAVGGLIDEKAVYAQAEQLQDFAEK